MNYSLPKGSLTDGEVVLADGGTSALVRLDRFRGASGSRLSVDGWRPLSASYANEQRVDKYLQEFIAEICPLVNHLNGDVKEAMNLVLSERNDDSQRDRLAAAKQLNSLVPFYRKISQALMMSGYLIKIDRLDTCDLWVEAEEWFDSDAHRNPPVCTLHIDEGNDRLWLGEGDGYHRTPFYDEKLSLPLQGSYNNLGEMIGRVKKGEHFQQLNGSRS